MMITDVASMVFACVCANHLGLVSAVEALVRIKLPVINCVKCLSFWIVLVFLLLHHVSVIHSLAASFFAAYSAMWLELFMGYVDYLFGKIYDKIYTTAGGDDLSHSPNRDKSNT